MNIYTLWVYLYTLLKVFIYEFFNPGLRYCYSSLSVAIQVEKVMPTPNKFQLQQSLWEVSGLMGPSLIHKEMLIDPILYTSCDDKGGYSELMGVMIIISRIHCFVVCLPIQGSCSLFAFLLRYFLYLGEGVNYIYLSWIPTLHHHLFPALHPVMDFSIGNCLL